MDGQAAVDALVAALATIGVAAGPTEPGDRTSTDVVVDVSGTPLAIQVKAAATVTPESLRKLFDSTPTPDGQYRPSVVVVADRVLGAAREVLKEAGWGWLDQRGHLRLTGPGVFIDATVPRVRPTAWTADPFAGSVGLEVACLLLMNPRQPIEIRRIARHISRSASAVSSVVDALRKSQLITRTGAVAVPEMFWAVASAWKPVSTDVARLSFIDDPAIANALRTGKNYPDDTTGWALTDAMAAAAYGAPIGIRAHYPPDFYVPDITTLRRAETLLGLPNDSDARGATIRVAPVPQVCSIRNPPNQDVASWPLANPLFVALDLANDPGRGQEVLESWTPPAGSTRVW